MDYCSSKFAAVGIDDAIKVELKVQGHADYIKTTVVCLEWVVKSLKILQSNLAIRNGLIRNKLVLRNHFTWPICHLLHKDKELLALRNNSWATKKFLIAKFDCTKRTRYIFPRFCSKSPSFGNSYRTRNSLPTFLCKSPSFGKFYRTNVWYIKNLTITVHSYVLQL